MQPNLCTESLGLSYQLWSSLDHKHTTKVVFLKNNSWSLRRSQPRPTLGLQPWSLRRSQRQPIFGLWSLRRSQPLISSSKYRRDSSRLSHSSSYHILVITYLFTNLIISVCPPFRPRPDSGTYYELMPMIEDAAIDRLNTLCRGSTLYPHHRTHGLVIPFGWTNDIPTKPTYCHDTLPATPTHSQLG